jgi:hypothetical protein
MKADQARALILWRTSATSSRPGRRSAGTGEDIGTGTAHDDQMDSTRLIICGVVPDPRHHGRNGPSTMSHPRLTKHHTSALRQDPDASRAEDKARAFVTG